MSFFPISHSLRCHLFIISQHGWRYRIPDRHRGTPFPHPPSSFHWPPVHHVSLSPASVPQWSGDNPQYPVFMFIRRLRDALSHLSFNSEQCVTLTPAGAALEDDFYSNCTDFEVFCDNLIKEFACSSRDLCLTSLRNFSDLLLTAPYRSVITKLSCMTRRSADFWLINAHNNIFSR